MRLNSAIERGRRVRTAGDWQSTTWECASLARWFEMDGCVLEPRDCGDGTWAVVASDGRTTAHVVATGLHAAADARDWIRREQRILPAELRRVMDSVQSVFDAGALG